MKEWVVVADEEGIENEEEVVPEENEILWIKYWKIWESWELDG